MLEMVCNSQKINLKKILLNMLHSTSDHFDNVPF